MKNMKSLSAALTLLTALGFMSAGITAHAEEVRYTYEDLLAMSDEEFIEKFGDSNSKEITAGFGDETLTDDEKFENLFPPISSGESYIENPMAKLRKSFLNGSLSPYYRFDVEESVPLDNTLTSADFGFPLEWKFMCFDGYEIIDEAAEEYDYIHQYQIYVPNEIYGDFEKYVRMDEAANQFDKYEEYSILSYGTPYGAGLVKGEIVPITTTTTVTTTTATTTTTVTSTAAETTSAQETTPEVTSAPEEITSTQAPTAAPTDVTSTTVTTKAPAKTTAAKKNNSPKTGDSGIAGIALAGVGAIAAAFALRSKEE
ncbi:MAG: hypothetical protein IJX77_06020 [Ruminococcus sp.]|nr:hypothetical protein [Ruminococcus sp.]